MLGCFASLSSPQARLVVANDGSLRETLVARAQALGIAARVSFVGRLNAVTQAAYYARARWYISLPTSDSVSVSVLEAMAYGCVPILSDLSANRELVQDGENGCILADGELPGPARLALLQARAGQVAGDNHAWVAEHALFAPCVKAFVARLRQLQGVPTMP